MALKVPQKYHLEPNTFQHPNYYTDVLEEYLTSDESRVLTKAVREIFGWEASRKTKQKRIALSIFLDGKFVEGERVACGVGLTRDRLLQALKGLHEFHILVKIDQNHPQGQLYELQTEKIDVKGLGSRKKVWDRQNSMKIVTARKAIGKKQLHDIEIRNSSCASGRVNIASTLPDCQDKHSSCPSGRVDNGALPDGQEVTLPDGQDTKKDNKKPSKREERESVKREKTAETISLSPSSSKSSSASHPKMSKQEYAEDVMMTVDEYAKLISQFGEEGTAARILKLSLYKGSTGKKYASDYKTILVWEHRDQANNLPRERASPPKPSGGQTNWERNLEAARIGAQQPEGRIG